MHPASPFKFRGMRLRGPLKHVECLLHIPMSEPQMSFAASIGGASNEALQHTEVRLVIIQHLKSKLHFSGGGDDKKIITVRLTSYTDILLLLLL